jgi:hypothetical protein
MAFQLGEKKLMTKCHHGSDGPPLKAFIFNTDQGDSGQEESLQYAQETAKALSHVMTTFPHLSLFDRVAIVVPDEPFLQHFQASLQQVLATNLDAARRGNSEQHGEIVLKSAAEATRAVRKPPAAVKEQWIPIDTVSNFDGLERMFVVCVGLDAPIEKEEEGAEARSRLYRGITRGLLMTVVVNEFVKGGWLEWLMHVQLEEAKSFDYDKSLQQQKPEEVGRQLAKQKVSDEGGGGVNVVGGGGGKKHPKQEVADGEGKMKQEGPATKPVEQSTAAGGDKNAQGKEVKAEQIKQTVWDTSAAIAAAGYNQQRPDFMPIAELAGGASRVLLSPGLGTPGA